MARRRKSEAISPTAHYTAQVWVRNGMSHPAFDTWQGRALYQALKPPLALYGLSGGPSLEQVLLARHRIIDHLLDAAIEAGEVSQVIEIAAGLSPRGWRCRRRFGDRVTYIEADLPDMALHKERLLRDIGALSAQHRCVSLDALLDEGAGSLSVLAGDLDPGKGLAIITEGLLNYFDRDAVLGMWGRFAGTLQAFEHGVYLSDLHLAGENRGAAISGFGKLLSTFVRGRIHLHFDTAIDAQGLLVKQGFAQAMLHQPTDFARDLQLDDDPSHRLVRIVQAKT